MQTFDLEALQGHPLCAKVPHVSDFKSVCISLVIGPIGLALEANLNHGLGIF